nr:MAG TPA: hypothetical protein [Caudoviricetes sp.]
MFNLGSVVFDLMLSLLSICNILHSLQNRSFSAIQLIPLKFHSLL